VRTLGPSLRAYLCGHTPMVNDCTLLLLEQGVPAEHIHGESY
jgi:ferredoxin-NADP reductase